MLASACQETIPTARHAATTRSFSAKGPGRPSGIGRPRCPCGSDTPSLAILTTPPSTLARAWPAFADPRRGSEAIQDAGAARRIGQRRGRGAVVETDADLRVPGQELLVGDAAEGRGREGARPVRGVPVGEELRQRRAP